MTFSLDPRIAEWLADMRSGHRSKLVNLALAHARETQIAVDAARGLGEAAPRDE
jgi:hypothetical protein